MARVGQKGFGIVELLVILVVLGVIAGLGFVFFMQMNKQDEDTSKTQTSTSIVAAADVISKIKQKLASDYVLKEAKGSEAPAPDPEKNVIGYVQGTAEPAWISEGYDFYTRYDGDGASIDLVYAAYYAGNSRSDKVISTRESLKRIIKNVFSDYSLKKSADSAYHVNTEAYVSNAVICTSNSDIEEFSGSISISCGNTSQYPNAAKESKPFVDVLRKAKPEMEETSGTTLALDVTDIEDGADGYQRAKTSIYGIDGAGGYMGLFYRKKGEGWQYWTGTQNVIPCTDYNTDALKSAFKGEACYIEGEEDNSKV